MGDTLVRLFGHIAPSPGVMSNGPPRRGGDEEGWCERMSNRVTGARRRRLTLLTLCVATFMISLDLTIVNVALPVIQREMRLTAGDLEWVISAYSLSLAALVPVGGALGDRYGRRLVFLTGMAVFALGSIACALSPSGAALIASRAVQGIGGAAMLALTLSIITETFPSATRARAIGIWAAIGGTGFGAGPVAGGILLTYFGWASVFWVNVPFAVAGVVGTVVAIRESRAPQSRCLDVPGVVTSAAGLVAITLGLIGSASYAWDTWPVAAPMVAGVGLLVGFAAWERHAPHAMLPTALLRSRSFVTASAIYLLSYPGLAGALFYVTLLYQDVDGWSVLRTGLSWLCMNAPFLLMAQSAGRLDRRFPATSVVATGCAVAAVGVFALSRVTTTTPFALTAVGYVLFGGGFGTFIPGTTHVAMRDVPPGVSGAASGMLNAARQIGTSVGLAVLGAIGVNAAVSDWHGRTGRSVAASAQAQNVGGGRIAAVTEALGPAYRHPAAQSFLHGYQLAVGVAAACLLAAAVVAVVAFRPASGRWRRLGLVQPERTHDHEGISVRHAERIRS